MGELKSGQYIYKMEIPVTVLYSKREDGTTSIDTVSIPTENDIYDMVSCCASAIKAGAESRI